MVNNHILYNLIDKNFYPCYYKHIKNNGTGYRNQED
jgi:hypothetical protein